MTTVFVPSIVLIDNPVVDFPKEEELLNFPAGTTLGVLNKISVVRTDFAVYNFKQNRTLQNIIQDSQASLIRQQALIIIQRYGLTVETANIAYMPGLTSKERRIVIDYLATVRR